MKKYNTYQIVASWNDDEPLPIRELKLPARKNRTRYLVVLQSMGTFSIVKKTNSYTTAARSAAYYHEGCSIHAAIFSMANYS